MKFALGVHTFLTYLRSHWLLLRGYSRIAGQMTTWLIQRQICYAADCRVIITDTRGAMNHQEDSAFPTALYVLGTHIGMSLKRIL